MKISLTPANAIRIICSIVFFMSASCANTSDTTADARAVLESTKNTSSTYTLHYLNSVTIPGEPIIEEVSAEFHQGDLHRVETPRDRIVANCRAGTGSHLSVTSGKLVEGKKVAAAACGINTNASIISIELLSDVQTKFGTARKVRVVDKENVREYTVSKEGVLLKTTYSENRHNGALLIVTEAFKLTNSVPDANMFSEDSLNRSFLPKKFAR
jgi:hypothetical protein